MITDRDVNLQLGTAYLKLVLDDFDGSQALAAAAYNAGPGRPRRWRDGPAAGTRGVGREHSVQRNARLRQEGAGQRRVLCSALRRTADAEGQLEAASWRHADRASHEPDRDAARATVPKQMSRDPFTAKPTDATFSCWAAPASSAQSLCERLVERRRRRPHPRADAAPGPCEDGAFAADGGARRVPTCTTTRRSRACSSGVDAVVNLVAILHGSADAFERVHVELPQRLAAACTRGRRAGVWCTSARWASAPMRHRTTCAARPPARRCCGGTGST